MVEQVCIAVTLDLYSGGARIESRYLEKVTSAFFQIFSNLSFINDLTFLRYIV